MKVTGLAPRWVSVEQIRKQPRMRRETVVAAMLSGELPYEQRGRIRYASLRSTAGPAAAHARDELSYTVDRGRGRSAPRGVSASAGGLTEGA
jgi:hypothetical protein